MRICWMLIIFPASALCDRCVLTHFWGEEEEAQM